MRALISFSLVVLLHCAWIENAVGQVAPPDGAVTFDRDIDPIEAQIRQQFVINSDGTGATQLTEVPSENGHGDWGRGPALQPSRIQLRRRPDATPGVSGVRPCARQNGSRRARLCRRRACTGPPG